MKTRWIAEFVDMSGLVIVAARSYDFLSAVNKAYDKIMKIPNRPEVKLVTRSY